MLSYDSLVQSGIRVVIRQTCTLRIYPTVFSTRDSTLRLLVAANMRCILLIEEWRRLIGVDVGRHLIALPVDLMNLRLRLALRASNAVEVAVALHDTVHFLELSVLR